MKVMFLAVALVLPVAAMAQSGHEAGYKWAARHGIERPEDCSGNSSSFIEGCEQYAYEVQRQKIDSGECEDEDQDELCDY